MFYLAAKTENAERKVVPRGIIRTVPAKISVLRFMLWILGLLHRYRIPYIVLLFVLFFIVSLTTETPVISFVESVCIFEGVMFSFAIHETAHWGIGTKLYGIKAEYIAFIPYNFVFSVCFKEEDKKLEPKQRARIFIAGPLIPIAIFGFIGLLVLLVALVFHCFAYAKLPLFICAEGIIINLFSFLPIPGTDWSRVKDYYLSKSVLGKFFNKVNGFTRKAYEFFITVMTNH